MYSNLTTLSISQNKKKLTFVKTQKDDFNPPQKKGERAPFYSALQTKEDFASTHHLTKRSPKRQVNTSLVGSILGLMYGEYD